MPGAGRPPWLANFPSGYSRIATPSQQSAVQYLGHYNTPTRLWRSSQNSPMMPIGYRPDAPKRTAQKIDIPPTRLFQPQATAPEARSPAGPEGPPKKVSAASSFFKKFSFCPSNAAFYKRGVIRTVPYETTAIYTLPA